MNQTNLHIWQKLHNRVVNKRNEIVKKLKSELFQEMWIYQRIKPNMWSIDEIFRHIVASEIFYVKKDFDLLKSASSWAVGAQWVGDRNFGLKKNPFFSFNELLEKCKQIERESKEFFIHLTDQMLEEEVTAPWGEKMSFENLLLHWYDHENQHIGQIQYMITYFLQENELHKK